jgi:hypothetical protein
MRAAPDPRAARIPTINGSEYDYLRARQPRCAPAHKGERQEAKRSYRRRFRHAVRLAVRIAEDT